MKTNSKRKSSIVNCKLSILLLLAAMLSGCAKDPVENPDNPDNTGGALVPAPKTTATFTVKNPGVAGSIQVYKIGQGTFVINFDPGALAGISALKITAATNGKGFFVEDANRLGQHVQLKAPAYLTYLPEKPLEQGEMLGKYSEDGTSFEPIATWAISSGGKTELFAPIDGFSPTGLGTPTPDQLQNLGQQAASGYIWRLEAQAKMIRYNNIGQIESSDNFFYLRADSKSALGGNSTVPSIFNGMLNQNYWIVTTVKWAFPGVSDNIPFPFQFNVSDHNLKLQMIPKFKKNPNFEAENKVYQDWESESLGSLAPDDALGSLAPDDDSLGSLAPDTPSKSKPKPPSKPKKYIFDGWIGHGKANMVLEDNSIIFGAVDENGKCTIAGTQFYSMPVAVSVKMGGNAIVDYTDPIFGPVGLPGTLTGISAAAAANPPELHNPAMDYAPGTPDNHFPPADNTVIDELKNISQQGNGNIFIVNGDSIILLGFENKSDPDIPNINDFLQAWNDAANSQWGGIEGNSSVGDPKGLVEYDGNSYFLHTGGYEVTQVYPDAENNIFYYEYIVGLKSATDETSFECDLVGNNSSQELLAGTYTVVEYDAAKPFMAFYASFTTPDGTEVGFDLGATIKVTKQNDTYSITVTGKTTEGKDAKVTYTGKL